MNKRFSRFIRLIYLSGDLLILNLSFFAAFFIRFGHFNIFEQNAKTFTELNHTIYYSELNHNYILIPLINVVWFIVGYVFDIYQIYRVTRIDQIIGHLMKALIINLLALAFIIVMFKSFEVSRLLLLYTYIIFVFMVLGWRILIYKYLKFFRKRGFNYRRVIIVGAGRMGKEMYQFLKSDLSYGYKFVGFFDDDPEKANKSFVLGTLDDVESFVKAEKIDEIYCALPVNASDKAIKILRFAENNLVRFKIIPDFSRYLHRKVNIDFYGSIPVVLLREEPLQSFFNRFFKRTFDIVFSLGVILLVFPWLFPILAGLIKFKSPGNVFFKQKRSGKGGEEFYCWKFRSMETNFHSDLKQATIGDARITPIGQFLRKTNLDELPQFFNVLAGHMSVVGPRPHMLKHTEEYSKIIDKFMLRHLIKPGITGWAQVSGFRGSTEVPEKMKKRVEHDVWYIENWTFMLDLRIILLTVTNMFKGEANAH